jgi:hypothetical protein
MLTGVEVHRIERLRRRWRQPTSEYHQVVVSVRHQALGVGCKNGNGAFNESGTSEFALSSACIRGTATTRAVIRNCFALRRYFESRMSVVGILWYRWCQKHPRISVASRRVAKRSCPGPGNDGQEAVCRMGGGGGWGSSRHSQPTHTSLNGDYMSISSSLPLCHRRAEMLSSISRTRGLASWSISLLIWWWNTCRCTEVLKAVTMTLARRSTSCTSRYENFLPFPRILILLLAFLATCDPQFVFTGPWLLSGCDFFFAALSFLSIVEHSLPERSSCLDDRTAAYL